MMLEGLKQWFCGLMRPGGYEGRMALRRSANMIGLQNAYELVYAEKGIDIAPYCNDILCTERRPGDMMTIKAFAELCGCSTQTLRYYDRVGVLRPAQVDRWSGYRYYEEQQAIDYIKIKNLQAADFTISEIMTLLGQSDEAVHAAFDRQIEAQEAKLRRIREIQGTYLREKSGMEKIIQGLTGYMLRDCGDSQTYLEFGLSREEAAQAAGAVEKWLGGALRRHLPGVGITLNINGETYDDQAQITAQLEQPDGDVKMLLLSDRVGSEQETFDPEVYETVWEKHGFSHVHEFLDDIPAPCAGQEQRYCFSFANDTFEGNASFAVYMLGAMRLRYGDKADMMSCVLKRSEDGLNHFALMRRK